MYYSASYDEDGYRGQVYYSLQNGSPVPIDEVVGDKAMSWDEVSEGAYAQAFTEAESKYLVYPDIGETFVMVLPEGELTDEAANVVLSSKFGSFEVEEPY